SRPLDDDKPLWQFTLIENYAGGAAILSRIHHCIADGIALIGVMLKLTDPDAAGDASHEAIVPAAAPEAAEADYEPERWKQLHAPLTAAAIRTIGYSGKAWSTYLELV